MDNSVGESIEVMWRGRSDERGGAITCGRDERK